MATVARFQGGELDGKELELDPRMPVQSYIETAVTVRPHFCQCPERHLDPPPTQTYRRAAHGYRGDTRIIIYRLEG